MGDGEREVSQLTGHQEDLEPLLSNRLIQLFGGTGAFRGNNIFGLNAPLLGDAADATRDILSGRVETGLLRRSVLEPSLRNFDREIAPRINAGFAGRGATFSTARGRTNADALDNVFSNYQASLADAYQRAQDRRLSALNVPIQQLQSVFGVGQNFLRPGAVDTVVSPDPLTLGAGLFGTALGGIGGGIGDAIGGSIGGK